MATPIDTERRSRDLDTCVDVSSAHLQQLRRAIHVLRDVGEGDLADSLSTWADQLAACRSKGSRRDLSNTEYWLG